MSELLVADIRKRVINTVRNGLFCGNSHDDILGDIYGLFDNIADEIKDAALAAPEAEAVREACAAVCDVGVTWEPPLPRDLAIASSETSYLLAKAIRALDLAKVGQ